MRFAADENFNGKVLAGLQARLPKVNIIRIQDTHLHSAPDPDVLAWTAAENRILLTHDVQTLVNDAYERVQQGMLMPGVIRVSDTIPIGMVIDELEVMIGAGKPEDFENQVKYIPMR